MSEPNSSQKEALQNAYRSLTEAVEHLQHAYMNDLPTIKGIRHARVALQNGVGNLISGERSEFEDSK